MFRSSSLGIFFIDKDCMMASRALSMFVRMSNKSACRCSFGTNVVRRWLTFDVTSSMDFEEKVVNSSTPVVIDFHAG